MRKPWGLVSWRKRREDFLKTRNKCEWCGSTEKLTIDHNKKPNTQNDKDYLDFKDVTVLCNRCAYARLKGFKLCISCHHYIKYGIYLTKQECINTGLIWKRKVHAVCWECFFKTPMGKKFK